MEALCPRDQGSSPQRGRVLRSLCRQTEHRKKQGMAGCPLPHAGALWWMGGGALKVSRLLKQTFTLLHS